MSRTIRKTRCLVEAGEFNVYEGTEVATTERGAFKTNRARIEGYVYRRMSMAERRQRAEERQRWNKF